MQLLRWHAQTDAVLTLMRQCCWETAHFAEEVIKQVHKTVSTYLTECAAPMLPSCVQY